MIEPPATLPDDEPPTPEVGGWAAEKHALVTLYARLFAKATGLRFD